MNCLELRVGSLSKIRGEVQAWIARHRIVSIRIDHFIDSANSPSTSTYRNLTLSCQVNHDFVSCIASMSPDCALWPVSGLHRKKEKTPQHVLWSCNRSEGARRDSRIVKLSLGRHALFHRWCPNSCADLWIDTLLCCYIDTSLC